MKPLVVFPDPVESIITYLTARLAEYEDDDFVSEPQMVQVTAWYPHGSSLEAPAIPHVQVNLDGTFQVAYPVTKRATIRVAVWHANPSPAAKLASLVSGLMQTHPGDGRVFAVNLLTGEMPTRDPNSGFYLQSMTFRVFPRPTEFSAAEPVG